MKDGRIFLGEALSELLWCYRRRAAAICCVLTLAGLTLCGFLAGTHRWSPPRAGGVQQKIAGEILRFHVIAESDSREEQERKLQVRDAVIEVLQSPLEGAKSLEETEDIVRAYLGKIQETAESVLLKNGSDASVKAELSTVWFPRKSYGEFTFPAGRYRALRIQIGRAEGKNWWCVLFPNLCFVDSVRGVMPEASEQKLKNVLSEEEYESLFDWKHSERKIRYPLLEWLRALPDAVTACLRSSPVCGE